MAVYPSPGGSFAEGLTSGFATGTELQYRKEVAQADARYRRALSDQQEWDTREAKRLQGLRGGIAALSGQIADPTYYSGTGLPTPESSPVEPSAAAGGYDFAAPGLGGGQFSPVQSASATSKRYAPAPEFVAQRSMLTDQRYRDADQLAAMQAQYYADKGDFASAQLMMNSGGAGILAQDITRLATAGLSLMHNAPGNPAAMRQAAAFFNEASTAYPDGRALYFDVVGNQLVAYPYNEQGVPESDRPVPVSLETAQAAFEGLRDPIGMQTMINKYKDMRAEVLYTPQTRGGGGGGADSLAGLAGILKAVSGDGGGGGSGIGDLQALDLGTGQPLYRAGDSIYEPNYLTDTTGNPTGRVNMETPFKFRQNLGGDRQADRNIEIRKLRLLESLVGGGGGGDAGQVIPDPVSLALGIKPGPFTEEVGEAPSSAIARGRAPPPPAFNPPPAITGSGTGLGGPPSDFAPPYKDEPGRAKKAAPSGVYPTPIGSTGLPPASQLTERSLVGENAKSAGDRRKRFSAEAVGFEGLLNSKQPHMAKFVLDKLNAYDLKELSPSQRRRAEQLSKRAKQILTTGK